ncbi:hypothetical protein D3C80_1116790 [compost metagenome]
MHCGQAAEPDSQAVAADPLGQLITGLKALRLGRQHALMRVEHQCLERFVGAGTVVAGVKVNRPSGDAQLVPALDLPREDLRQLPGGQLWQRVVGVDDHRHAIQADDLLGAGRAQIAQGLQLAHFCVVDWP